MSWTDFYRRRDALDAVLEHARHDPAGTLPFAEVPEAAEVFTGPEDLLLALHHRWTMKLTGRLGVALAEAGRDPGIDPVDAVLAGWRATAVEHGTLRRLLDAGAAEHAAALRPAIEGEQRLLALTAGLAEHGDTPEEIIRVGATLLALLRDAPEHPARRRGPVEQLLRRLVASA
jgi:hypothetical protein